jgi:WD40 repeat protein
VAVSPDGRRIVSGSYDDHVVAVWDLESGTPIRELGRYQIRVTSVAVSPDGRCVIAGSLPDTITVWDLESGTHVHALSGHREAVWSVAVSPDGRRIVSGSEGGTVAVWDPKSGQRLASLTLDGRVLSIAWHQNGHSIWAGDTHGNLYRLEYREP